jgi:ABC-type nitrate/sulfonate/bicarbonate transport system substrate-binding protein
MVERSRAAAARRLIVVAALLPLLITGGACRSDGTADGPAGAPAAGSPAPAAAPGGAASAAPRRVRLGLAIPSYVHAVAWIAQERGFFARHGLDVEVVTFAGSPPTLKGILAGDLQIGLAGGDSAIKANLAGADLVVFASLVSRHYHRLVARADIRSPEDLRGHTVGVPVLGGPQDFLVHVACRKWGLAYGTDVRVQVLGEELARLSAVVDGRVDAISSALPSAKIRALGLTTLADPRTWDEPAPYMVAVAQREFLTRHPDIARDFLRAIADAQTFYLDEPDAALSLVGGRLGAALGDAHDNYAEGGPLLYVIPPAPDARALSVAWDYIRTDEAFRDRTEGFDLARMIDGTVVAELVREGAFEAAAAARERRAARMAAPAEAIAPTAPAAATVGTEGQP